MTDLLEKAMTIARTFPADTQDDVAEMVLAFLDVGDVVPLTPAEEADIEKAEAEVARGDFATDAEMHALWAKHDP